jgi:DNA end-binding protein Ku
MRDVLAVETPFFCDEVRDPAALAPGLGGARVDESELELATQHIEMLKTEWDPAAYADTYREGLLRILAEKAPTPRASAPPHEPTAAGTSTVEQLMTALKESVEAAKAKQKPGRRPCSKGAG